jgi:hypothetical protein
MFRKIFTYFADKIVYYLKKWRLEKILKKYENSLNFEDGEKWYEAYVEWCFHTKSDNNIYC